jgi:hypothetical protein
MYWLFSSDCSQEILSVIEHGDSVRLLYVTRFNGMYIKRIQPLEVIKMTLQL